MPFRRRTYRRKTSGKGRLSASMYKAVNRIARRQATKRLEKKYHDYDSGNYNSGDWSGVISSLTSITQGDTDTTRDGDKVWLKSLSFRGTIDNEQAVSPVNTVVRLIIFQWFDDTSPTPADILQAGALATSAAPLAHWYHDTRMKFSVLWDRTFVVTALADGSTPVKTFKGHLRKFRKNQVAFDAATTTGVNKLYALTVSNTGTAASVPFVEILYRTSFMDP